MPEPCSEGLAKGKPLLTSYTMSTSANLFPAKRQTTIEKKDNMEIRLVY